MGHFVSLLLLLGQNKLECWSQNNFFRASLTKDDRLTRRNLLQTLCLTFPLQQGQINMFNDIKTRVQFNKKNLYP
jgi:hypothetical protein